MISKRGGMVTYIADMVEEEGKRLNEVIAVIIEETAKMPKGSIVWKTIDKKVYPYLQWREGDKIKARFVKREELSELQEVIQQRREYEKRVKELKGYVREIEKMLGRLIK